MKVIVGRDLPKIGWCGAEPLDPAKFVPPALPDMEMFADLTKPFPGGLWCSPVVRAGRKRQIVGTAWTSREGGVDPFTIVRPHRGARAVVIDSRDDLIEAISRWPDDRSNPRMDRFNEIAGVSRDQAIRIDWSAMSREIDAVYVTDDALDELNLPHKYPHLWGWDVPTVLFLNPTFSPGRVITDPPDDAARDAMNYAGLRVDIERSVQRGKLSRARADQILSLTGEMLDIRRVEREHFNAL